MHELDSTTEAIKSPSQRKKYAEHRNALLFSGEVLGSWLVNLAVGILRVATGLGLTVLHGWQKMPPPSEFVTGLEGKGFPAAYFFALLAAGTEAVAGICLALGLATRLAALMLVMVMSVALFIWHVGDPLRVLEPALTYFILGLFFMLVGGGKLSLDAVLRRKPKPASSQATKPATD